MTTIYFKCKTERTLLCQSGHRKFPIWFTEDFDKNRGSVREVMENWKVVASWCAEQFGPEGDRWGVNIDEDTLNYFCFQDTVDATAFRIRWG